MGGLVAHGMGDAGHVHGIRDNDAHQDERVEPKSRRDLESGQ